MAKKETTCRDAAIAFALTVTRISEIDQHLDRANVQIGEMLAKIATGDKDARAKAGQLSMRRSTLEADRRNLVLQRDGLKIEADIAAAEEAAQKGVDAVKVFEEVTAEARELEQQFAALMREVIGVAQKLQVTGREWDKARGEAGRHADVASVVAPRAPGFLFNLSSIEQGDIAVDRWLKDPVKRVQAHPEFVQTVEQHDAFTFIGERMTGRVA